MFNSTLLLRLLRRYAPHNDSKKSHSEPLGEESTENVNFTRHFELKW